MRTLRSVDVLKSMTVGQLQRLQDMLTEMSFADGDFVIQQGEHSETFYVIVEGRVRCTKREHPADAEIELMQLGEGQYFGERALLTSAPRAANVIAVGKLKCLHISKDAFEEVLGPLQNIINDDRAAREKVAMQKQLQQETEGLAAVARKDLKMVGLAVEIYHGQLVLVKHKLGQEYTLKAISKSQAVERSLQARVMNEKLLLSTLATPSRFVPLALTSFLDEAYLCIVFKARVVTEMNALIERAVFSEAQARFYAGSLTLALAHLHSEGIVYRNLMPENIGIDMYGYVQLIDLHFAIKLDDPPARDYSGRADYLSPEQVSGQGHSLPVDFWALGVLLYEMLTGSGPWITGDPNADSEVAIYNRISSHQPGGVPLPKDLGFSDDLAQLLNDLLAPNPVKRLGCRGAGAEEIKTYKWFSGFNWGECESGEMTAPHADLCTEALEIAEKAASNCMPEEAGSYTSEEDWYAGFGSFLAPGK